MFENIRKSAYTIILAALLLLGVFALGAHFGDSIDTWSNSIRGFGHMDVRTNINSGGDVARDVAMVSGGAVVYKSEATWGDGTKIEFVSSYEVDVGKHEKGVPYTNRYLVGMYSDVMQTKHYLVAYDISGPFSANAAFITAEYSTSGTIEMSSDQGFAKFKGKMQKFNGGDLSTAETDLVGNFTIEQALETTKDPNYNITLDPLGFCAQLDRDMILDDSVPGGIYIVPDGYKVLNGYLVPEETARVPSDISADYYIIPDGYMVDEDGRVVSANPNELIITSTGSDILGDYVITSDGSKYRIPPGFTVKDGKLIKVAI